jgi:hypothetical protein
LISSQPVFALSPYLDSSFAAEESLEPSTSQEATIERMDEVHVGCFYSGMIY